MFLKDFSLWLLLFSLKAWVRLLNCPFFLHLSVAFGVGWGAAPVLVLPDAHCHFGDPGSGPPGWLSPLSGDPGSEALLSRVGSRDPRSPHSKSASLLGSVTWSPLRRLARGWQREEAIVSWSLYAFPLPLKC